MKRTVFIILALCFSGSALAQNGQFGRSPSTDRAGLYLDLGGRSGPTAVVGEIGVAGYPRQNLALRASLSFLAYENNPDTLVGLNAGARYSVGHTLSPFIGVGLFAGAASEDIPAENDNIDNDNDGAIDEDGEVESITTDIMASVYPELGFHLWATKNIRMTVSSKYHITTKGRSSDFLMYNFGIAFGFN